MPIDEVLLRDCCGKSSSKLKKYFYYNEYSRDNFRFKSDYNELTLLDLIDGKISFIDIIFMFFPYILILILAFACIGIWISICICSRKPKCLLKKNNKNPKKARFTCFLIFLGFSIALLILGINILVYINMAEKNFNGSICSLLMFQYEIVNGQGLLARNQINKPYWYGSTQIGENIEKINGLITILQTNCPTLLTNLNSAYENNEKFIKNLIKSLESIYSVNKENKIEVDAIGGSNKIQIIPSYILNLGPKEKSSTLTGKIYEEFKNNYSYMFLDIIAPVKLLCENIVPASPGGGVAGGRRRNLDGSALSTGLGNFNSVIGELNNALDSVASTLTDYIANYKSYIINFIYKINFYLFVVNIGCIIIEIIFYTIYYFHPFSLIKCNIYFFIHLINFLLILCFIYNSIFGIFSLLMGNVADIVDAVLSKENLSSESPKIIGEEENIKKLEKCLRGDGNLFDEFITDEMKQIIEPLNILYTIYTPVRTINEKLNPTNPLVQNEKNEYNSFMKLEEIINNLKNMIDDFIPTTTKESAGNYDIQTLLDSLTSYTNNDVNHITDCITYDTWTTISNNCPNENPGIIDNNKCKTLKTFFPDLEEDNTCTTSSPQKRDAECEANKISKIYDSGCSVNQPQIKSYSKTLLQYYLDNKSIINGILGNINGGTISDETTAYDLYKVKNDFDEKFIGKVKTVISSIDEKITTKVYEVFDEFLNNASKDTYQLRNSKDFNIFSWMNCSAIGQDYNATLSILKSSLTKELKIVTIVSLLFEFLSIANLYIMVGLSKNLIDKQYEMNEEKNSIEEVDINELKGTEKGCEIYTMKNKDKIDSTQKFNKKKYDNANPELVSISGSDRRNLTQNGEKVKDILNMKRKNKKGDEVKNSHFTKTD